MKDLTDREIERRTKLAKLEQLEISNEKERLALEDKKGALCRIDAALSEFNTFLVDFKNMMLQFPDFVQKTIPACNPQQYKAIQDFIDDNIQRLRQKQIYLSIESTSEERRKMTEYINSSRMKNTTIKESDK